MRHRRPKNTLGASRDGARLRRGLEATRAGVRVPGTPEAVLPRDLQHHPERAPSGVLLLGQASPPLEVRKSASVSSTLRSGSQRSELVISSATTKAIRLSAWEWPTSELKLWRSTPTRALGNVSQVD